MTYAVSSGALNSTPTKSAANRVLQLLAALLQTCVHLVACKNLLCCPALCCELDDICYVVVTVTAVCILTGQMYRYLCFLAGS